MARLSRLPLRAAGLIAAGLLAGPSVPAAAASPEEQAQICAEAAERYKEQFGRAMTDEPVQIIAMYKYTFCPPKLSVKQGSKVRFVNLDKRTTHSYWFRDAGRPESERYFGGEGNEMTMDLPPGTHTYLCGPHFEREGMVGEITIAP